VRVKNVEERFPLVGDQSTVDPSSVGAADTTLNAIIALCPDNSVVGRDEDLRLDFGMEVGAGRQNDVEASHR
jgi:hypothetical protein